MERVRDGKGMEGKGKKGEHLALVGSSSDGFIVIIKMCPVCSPI